MEYIGTNMKWGYVHDGEHIPELGNNWRKKYKTLSVDEALSNNVGTCIERVEVAKDGLRNLGFNPTSFCIRDSNIVKSNSGHCFAVYNVDGIWNWFESSLERNKGIHTFDCLDELLGTVIPIYFKQESLQPTYNWLISEYDDIPGNLSYAEFSAVMDYTQMPKEIIGSAFNPKNARILRPSTEELITIKY